MKLQAEATGMSSRVSTLLVLCGFCVGMGVGVSVAGADTIPLGDGGSWYETVVETDKQVYQLGEPVHITCRLTNVSMDEHTICVDVQGLVPCVTQDGQKLWDGVGGGWLPAYWEHILGPGEFLEDQWAWDMTTLDGTPVGPGGYEVSGCRIAGKPSTTITIVPEPATLVLLAIGMGASLLRRKPD